MGIIIKTKEQIEGIRKSSQLAAKCLDFIAPYVKEGVSTGELDRKIEDFIRQNNAIPAPLNYHGFPKATCISPNSVVCHGIPDDNTILKNGDIINIDVTTILDGYYGDTSRMYKVGDVTTQASDLVEATKHCLDLGIGQVKPGNKFGNIGYVISRYAKSKGYSVVFEFCGHGVGIDFHEDPQVEHSARKNTGAVMKPGMIFTIEPMINLGKPRVNINEEDGWTATTIDNKLSAQFEHTVLVTETGVEVLTDIHGEYN